MRTPADTAAALEDPKLPVLHHGFTGLKDEDMVADTQIKPEEEEKFARFITTELKTASEEDAKLHFQVCTYSQCDLALSLCCTCIDWRRRNRRAVSQSRAEG